MKYDILILVSYMKKEHIIKLLDLSISILIYALILLAFSLIFKKTLYIDNRYFGIFSILTSIIIFLLNRTVKPLLIWLTLPITGLTLGLFYPVINVIILKLADFIMMNHFSINGYIMPLIVAILISLSNIIIDAMVHKLLEGKKYE